jgi:predicted RNase H-like HicB family nuclease
MKSYIFRVELSQDEDGRWKAVIPSLKACYTWGNTRDEALAYIQDALRCCLADMIAHEEPLPTDVEIIDAPVATVTL